MIFSSKMNFNKTLTIIVSLLISAFVNAQYPAGKSDNQATNMADAFKEPKNENITFSFVQISDILYNAENEEQNSALKKAIEEINDEQEVAFVIISGNVSENGDYNSLAAAKKLLDKLNKPYYIIPGESDVRKSESAGCSFKQIFGDDKFRILFNGFVFIGINTTPGNNGYGHIAKQDIAWIERQFKNVGKKTPVFVVAQYPMTQKYVDNALTISNIVRKYNTQAYIGSYCNMSGLDSYDGIMGIMSKSDNENGLSGYTLYSMKEDSLVIFDKATGMQPKFRAAIPIEQKFHVEGESSQYFRSAFAVNSEYKNIKIVWKREYEYGIYTPAVYNDNRLYFGDEKGVLHIVSSDKGKETGKFTTSGKIVSTPAISGGRVIFGSCNKSLYCISAETGKQLWRTQLANAVITSPIIENDIIYIGTAKNTYSIDINSGDVLSQKNEFDGLKSADLAAATDSRIGIDNDTKLTPLSISKDNNICFYRSENNRITAKRADNAMTILWETEFEEAEKIDPRTFAENGNRVVFGTIDGLVICVDKADGRIVWKYKTGTSAINRPTAISGNEWIITTVNGIVYCIKEK